MSGERAAVPDAAIRELLRLHYSDVWRVLRRLGVSESTVEDAAQHVFLVASGKLSLIEAGKARAFLVGIAVRVASNHRKSACVRYEHADEDVGARADGAPCAEELLDEKRLRTLLDEVLDSLPEDLREVLVLFELEELATNDIAELLGIPRGTVASRLRRAREAFEERARRVRARHGFSKEA